MINSSDLKIYQGKGFSFQYPDNWRQEGFNQYDTYGLPVIFSFMESGKKYQFEVAAGGRGGPEADQIQNTTVLINNKSFTKRMWIAKGKPFFVSLIPDETGFSLFNHIEMTLPPENNAQYVAIFDRIVSTLQIQ